MPDDNALLHRIQQLQFESLPEAEALLLPFIQLTFPDLHVEKVQLRPQAVSLNSFNGFLTLADETRLFFKTHTEQDNVLDEYYNATMLANAGYPVVKPLHSSTKAGQHLLIYEVITAPSVFDLSWRIENHEDPDEEQVLSALTKAQNDADDHLLTLYRETLETQSAAESAKAPVHQLFCHRIVGGRMQRFYGSLEGRQGEDAELYLPHGRFPMSQMYRIHWEINDQVYDDTLEDIIRRATVLLSPVQAGPSVIGHGDAHNGNVFFMREDDPPSLTYFDPAFAGRHHPLLDLTKPLFHNVFAMWMYFPKIKRNQIMMSVRRKGDDVLNVRHNYALPPLRYMFLESKVQRTLIPTLQVLKQENMLRDDWRVYLKAALFCCPFLTLNLADTERFPPEISLLGLAMAVEMGAESKGERSLIDQTLDEVEKAL